MRKLLCGFIFAALTGLLSLPISYVVGGDNATAFPTFRMQELETELGVGYAVVLADVNGDGKPDIVVVDQTRVIWYENPTWKKRTIIQGGTKPDNVCIAAHDIDGDGKIDFALGAEWKPFNPVGTLQWLKRGKTLDEPWTIYPIDTEPTIHRIRFMDLEVTGKTVLVSVPLMGRGATAKNNWLDGAPVRVTAYSIPKDPTKDRWTPTVLDETMHVCHNFCAAGLITNRATGNDFLVASYEGVSHLALELGKWSRTQIGTGNQETPAGKRGASEIKMGRLKGGFVIATIEPWHGDQVVVYTPPADGNKLWDRHVIDEQLRWGHAVSFADLDGDGNEELIVGVRDDPAKGDKVKDRRGVRIYKALDAKGAKWARHIVDDGGVAVEDLVAGDLNGDGKIDIVAVGRQTHNVRIYWNEGMKK
jgi:FG-GAP-like repeat